MHTPELLIFDLDGTLIDSSADIAACVNHTIARFGRPPLPIPTIAAYVGVGVQPLLTEVFPEGNDAFFAEVLASFNDCYARHLTEHTRLFEGVREGLSFFAATSKVILTNKRQRFADAIVDKLGLRSHFLSVHGREAFPTCKPHPGPIQAICARYGVTPQRSAMIGDTEVDIEAGRAAGAIAVGVSYGYGDKLKLRAAGPAFVIGSFAELTTLFNP